MALINIGPQLTTFLGNYIQKILLVGDSKVFRGGKLQK